jgi:hypothetical protein
VGEHFDQGLLNLEPKVNLGLRRHGRQSKSMSARARYNPPSLRTLKIRGTKSLQNLHLRSTRLKLHHTNNLKPLHHSSDHLQAPGLRQPTQPPQPLWPIRGKHRHNKRDRERFNGRRQIFLPTYLLLAPINVRMVLLPLIIMDEHRSRNLLNSLSMIQESMRT